MTYTSHETAIINAGAVIKSDVAAYAIMVGVPAKKIGYMCQCGVALHNKFNIFRIT